MNVKMKMATIGTTITATIAAVVLSIAPAGALGMPWMPPPMPMDDDFSASNKVITEVTKKNYVDVANSASQTAVSGSVNMAHMDDINGNLATGNASNTGTSNMTVTTSNSTNTPAAAAPSVPPTDLTKFDDVTLKNFVKTDTYSKNDVDVTNTVTQNAVSGSVNVHCIDDAEGATTGNASNTLTMGTTVTTSN